MMRTQISLERDMYDQAKKEAARQGVSFAELVRRALARVLRDDSSDKPWMRLAGVIEGGGLDASQTVDAVVYGQKRP